MIGLISTIVGYKFGTNFGKYSIKYKHKRLTPPKPLSLKLIMFSTLVLGILFNTPNLLALDLRPIILYESAEYIKGAESLLPTVGMLFLSITAGWDFICLYNLKINKLFNVIPILKLSFVLLYSGSRMTMLWPIIMFVAFYYIYRKIKLKHIIYMLILFPIIVFLMVSYKYILTFGFNMGFTKQLIALRFATDFAPEYREFARLVKLIPAKYDYIGVSKIIDNMFLTIIPNELLRLFSFDKGIYYNPIGNINREMLFHSGSLGIRTSLYGDMFVSSGIIGISFISLAIGVLLGYNNKKSMFSPIAFLMVINISTLQLFTLETFLLRCLMIFLSTLFYNHYIKYIFANHQGRESKNENYLLSQSISGTGI
jgi:hypothetical protein